MPCSATPPTPARPGTARPPSRRSPSTRRWPRSTRASPAGASRSRRRSPTGRARSPSSAPADDPATGALHRAALRGTAPGAVVALGDPGAGPAGVPLLADRPLRDGKPTAYVCRHFVCDAPDHRPGCAGGGSRRPTVTDLPRPSATYRVRDLTDDDLAEIESWRYDGPWSVYDSDGPLDPALGYWAVTRERTGGWPASAASARRPASPAWATRTGAVDVGVGMRPDLVGRGSGVRFASAFLDFAAGQVAADRFRVVV